MARAAASRSVPRALVGLLGLLAAVVVSQQEERQQVDISQLPTRGMSAYWGEGWEDPALKRQVYTALPVVADDDSVAKLAIVATDYNDDFNWETFEEDGGRSRVRGKVGYESQDLKSWVPRYDAVQHGHYMLYRFDADVSELGGSNLMEDFFFSLSIDVGIHPDYQYASTIRGPVGDTAAGANGTLRFSLYESKPADLDDPQQELFMVNEKAAHTKTIIGGNPEDVWTRIHRVTWGLSLEGDEGFEVLNSNCSRSVSELWLGVQCLRGYAFQSDTCATDALKPPQLDDCRSYCPYTLEVRAVPRVLNDGDAVRSLIGPGQWQLFAIDVGDYDLLEVTIERDEFDNVTYPDAFRDGLFGRAWLSKDSCLSGSTFSTEFYEGYCPHGGTLHVDDMGRDVNPHPHCSRVANYSYEIDLPDASTYVREMLVSPGGGVLNDLGYGAVVEEIAERDVALDAEMHYPSQLKIMAQLDQLHATADSLSFTNAVWKRSWPVRMCTSPLEAGRYYLSVYASHGMDPSRHSGHFTVKYVNQRFMRGPVVDRQPRRGCLQRGGSERLSLSTPASNPELTSLGLAEVRPYFVTEASANNLVSTMTVRRGAAPTATDFDIQVQQPHLRAAMSACDVSLAQTWHFALSLAPDSAATEVFFELDARLEDATRSLGDALDGFACCGQYKYYAFEGLDERLAPLADFELTSGHIKALYWRYDTCPVEEEHVADGKCIGWCELDWYRIFSLNLGRTKYLERSTLAVPYGMGEEPDKRRGGRWYLGIQALDEPATYTLSTSFRAPGLSRQGAAACSRLDRYCPQKFDASGLNSAAPRRRGGGEAWASVLLALVPALAAGLLALCTYRV